jgi:hypothetical protein
MKETNPIPYDITKDLTRSFRFTDVRLIFPALTDPDTRFDPCFKTGILFESETCEEAEAFTALYNEIREEFIAAVSGVYIKEPKKGWKMKDLRWREQDEEDDENTGVFLEAKAKAVDNKGNDLTVLVVDSKRAPLPEGTIVGGGSVANIAVELAPYYMPAHGMGVSIKLVGAQITTLRTGRREIKAEDTFDQIEGGFDSGAGSDTVASGGGGAF